MAAQEPQFKTVAKAFVQFFYQTFAANRAGLANVYQKGSMLTFNGTKCQGPENIVKQYQTLPWKKIAHQIKTLDAQPSGANNGILVFVTGDFVIDNGELAKFAQSFHLQPMSDNPSNYFIYNDCFRLNL